MIALLIAAVVIFAAFLLLAFFVAPRAKYSNIENLLGTDIFAHRGLFKNTAVPENSFSAFEAAVNRGYGIELDVHISSDGVPIVIHDSSLKRICGMDEMVENLPLCDIKLLNLFGGNETVPTLHEVLKLVSGAVPLIIEIKTYKGNYKKVCRAVCDLLSEYSGKYSIESFDPLVLIWFRRHKMDVVRGILAPGAPENSGKLLSVALMHGAVLLLNFLTKPDFIAFDHRFKNLFLFRFIRFVFHVTAALWTIKGLKSANELTQKYDAAIFEE